MELVQIDIEPLMLTFKEISFRPLTDVKKKMQWDLMYDPTYATSCHATYMAEGIILGLNIKSYHTVLLVPLPGNLHSCCWEPHQLMKLQTAGVYGAPL